MAYAGFQLCVAVTTYLLLLPREPQYFAPSATKAPPPTRAAALPKLSNHGLLPLLATTIALASVISTMLSVHLLAILQGEGFTLAAAVGLGALVGPSQVGARTIEMLIARFHHPIWTKLASASLVAAGLTALWVGPSVIVLALVLYGAGIGLESIARGTLPLAIFGPERYPTIMGRIAMPSLLAQAAAPSIGMALIDVVGFGGALRTIIAAAICNVLLALVLSMLLRKRLFSS